MFTPVNTPVALNAAVAAAKAGRPARKWAYQLAYNAVGGEGAVLFITYWVGGGNYGKRRLERSPVAVFENDGQPLAWDDARAVVDAALSDAEVKDYGPGEDGQPRAAKPTSTGERVAVVDRAAAIIAAFG
jgi:hypothetical protein